MHSYDPLLDARDGFDVLVSVGHREDSEDTRTRFATDDLQAFLARGAVRDRYMPTVLLIDILHHLTEHGAMRRCVLQLVETYIVVDHLVDESVLQLLLREIKPPADAQGKVREMFLTEQPYPFLAGHLPHVGARVR